MKTLNTFHPVETLIWKINRAERSHQVHLLAPLLQIPAGRAWFLRKLQCPCDEPESSAAEVFHLCFPLRDVFTTDYYQCRGTTDLEYQFIAYYNELFGFPQGFGVQEVWLTAPGNELRHPGAPGRAGWHDAFLDQNIPDEDLRQRARDVRRMLGTEADLLLHTTNHVVLIELKYLSALSMEQYERQIMMGETLAERLKKGFHFGLVVKDERDPIFTKIEEPYIRWDDVKRKLKTLSG